MDYAIRQTESGLEIGLSGRLTLRDHDDFRDIVAQIAVAPGRRVIFNLSHLDFLDSTGLGMLLLAQDTARTHGGHVVLRSAQPQVRRLLDLARLDTLFTIED